MRKLTTILAVAPMTVLLSLTADAGIFGRRAAVQYQTQCAGGSCATMTAPYGYGYVPARPLAVNPAWVAAPQTQPSAPAYQPSALALVNQLRASYGRPPLAWDSVLAAAAATNIYTRRYGYHYPGSDGGAAQCWSSTPDVAASLRMWAASPAHLAIILNATTSVGVSPCPSGCTLNAR